MSAALAVPAFAQAPRPATRPAAAAAATPATQPTRVERMLRDLADPDPAVRDASYSALLNLTRDDLPALRDAITAARPLSPAQSALLREVVTQVYLAGEPYAVDPDQLRGFLGLMQPPTDYVVVRADRAAPGAAVDGAGGGSTEYLLGVPVGERLPGFCAYRALRSGDVILALLEARRIPLREWGELQLAVAQAGPGQTVAFEVLRNGRLLKVPIRLDPRPRSVGGGFDVLEDIRRREERADEYWETNFAPLIGREMS